MFSLDTFEMIFLSFQKWQMEKLFRERAAKSDKKGEPKLVLPQLAKLDSRMYKPGKNDHDKLF